MDGWILLFQIIKHCSLLHKDMMIEFIQCIRPHPTFHFITKMFKTSMYFRSWYTKKLYYNVHIVYKTHNDKAKRSNLIFFCYGVHEKRPWEFSKYLHFLQKLESSLFSTTHRVKDIYKKVHTVSPLALSKFSMQLRDNKQKNKKLFIQQYFFSSFNKQCLSETSDEHWQRSPTHE